MAIYWLPMSDNSSLPSPPPLHLHRSLLPTPPFSSSPPPLHFHRSLLPHRSIFVYTYAIVLFTLYGLVKKAATDQWFYEAAGGDEKIPKKEALLRFKYYLWPEADKLHSWPCWYWWRISAFIAHIRCFTVHASVEMCMHGEYAVQKKWQNALLHDKNSERHSIISADAFSSLQII